MKGWCCRRTSLHPTSLTGYILRWRLLDEQFAPCFTVNYLVVQLTRSSWIIFVCACQRLISPETLFLTNCFAVQNIYLLLQSTSEEGNRWKGNLTPGEKETKYTLKGWKGRSSGPFSILVHQERKRKKFEIKLDTIKKILTFAVPTNRELLNGC
jgi:hypothetical protein